MWEGIIEKGSKWCYPTPESFKSGMRNIYKDYRKYKSFAKKLKESIKENFSEHTVSNLMSDNILSCLYEDLNNLELKVYN